MAYPTGGLAWAMAQIRLLNVKESRVLRDNVSVVRGTECYGLFVGAVCVHKSAFPSMIQDSIAHIWHANGWQEE